MTNLNIQRNVQTVFILCFSIKARTETIFFSILKLDQFLSIFCYIPSFQIVFVVYNNITLLLITTIIALILHIFIITYSILGICKPNHIGKVPFYIYILLRSLYYFSIQLFSIFKWSTILAYIFDIYLYAKDDFDKPPLAYLHEGVQEESNNRLLESNKFSIQGSLQQEISTKLIICFINLLITAISTYSQYLSFVIHQCWYKKSEQWENSSKVNNSRVIKSSSK